jgi:preprotein translocase subunit YajC
VWMDIAYAAGPQGARGMGELFNSLFLFLPLIVIFYFLIFRPQQKQRREMQQMLTNLKKGDSIVTRGGIEAIIDKVEEKRLRIDVGNGLRMWMNRDYVDRVETK